MSARPSAASSQHSAISTQQRQKQSTGRSACATKIQEQKNQEQKNQESEPSQGPWVAFLLLKTQQPAIKAASEMVYLDRLTSAAEADLFNSNTAGINACPTHCGTKQLWNRISH